MLLVLLLLPALVLAYSFSAGLVSTWLHHYLLNTSKSGEYSHDHRMCVFASFFWPLPLFALGLVCVGRLIKFIYQYPARIYNEVQSRRKKMQADKK